MSLKDPTNNNHGSAAANSIIDMISSLQDVARCQEQNWEGRFTDYLDIVRSDPSVARNAYQRLYDKKLKAEAAAARGEPLYMIERNGLKVERDEKKALGESYFLQKTNLE